MPKAQFLAHIIATASSISVATHYFYKGSEDDDELGLEVTG
jgi:hypothetical protein